MTVQFNLGVDEGDIEEPLQVVPEQLTNEELLGLEWGYIAKEGEEKMKLWKKRKNPKKTHSGGYSRRFCRPLQGH